MLDNIGSRILRIGDELMGPKSSEFMSWQCLNEASCAVTEATMGVRHYARAENKKAA
jgi:hypothetical protein